MTQPITKLQSGAFAFLGLASILSVLAACYTELYYVALIPFGLVVAYVAVADFKLLYYLLLFSIPLSIEYSFGSTLATDLPDEPLMIGLMLVTTLFLAGNYKALPTGFFRHFIMLALLLHIFWIFVSAVQSTNFLFSIKWFVSKLWYVTTFCLLTAIVVRTKQDLQRAFWCIFIPLTLLMIQVMVRHAMLGFSFDEINEPMMPFFRNHVNYAAILSIFFPFILLARTWYAKGNFVRGMLTFSALLYVVAIYLSYTRTCYIALLVIAPVYFILKHRWMKPALVMLFVTLTLLVVYLFKDNNYLKFAPEFEDTIIHDEFGEHLSSTFEGKDVSSMERVYRWVAATYMFRDRPVFGFGPGTFYPAYMRYTVTSFETYVSDNPERSTTHNYFLYLLAEQGAVGLGIFFLLTIVVFAYGEKIYHRLTDADDKRAVLTLLIVLAMVYVNLLLSDMLESDKVGPFFFICIALLVAADIKGKTSAT